MSLCQQTRVITIAQLPESDDDGGETEDDVEEADYDEDGIDEHGSLP